MKRNPFRLLLGVSLCVLTLSAITQEAAAPDAGNPAPPPTAGQRVLNALPSGEKVAVIPVEGIIYGYTTESIQTRVDRAIAGGAQVVVLELNTPGGVVTDAMAIARYLRDLQGVTTVAWVRPEAYSAGSLIASACDVIFVSPNSSFGDSAPVSPVGELAPTERAKILSPLLEAYEDNARANGLDFAPLKAMCVLGYEVYYVQHPDTGQRRLVNEADFAVMVGGEEPADVEAEMTEGLSALDELTLVGLAKVTVNRDEMGVWEPVLTLPSGATLPNGRVHDGTTLYTLSETEAVDIGLAAAIVADDAALRTRLNAASVTRVNAPWYAQMAFILSHPMVRGVLVFVALLGLYFELQAPGLGLGGFLAGLAIIGLVLGPALTGLAQFWHIVLILLGIILIVGEMLTAVTAGFMAIVGILMLLTGLALSVVPTSGSGALPLPASGTEDLLLNSTLSTVGSLLVSIAAMVLLTRYFGSVPVLNRLILTDDRDARRPASAPAEVGGDFVLGGTGQPLAIGTAAVVSETGLRPSGRIEVQGKLIDAVSTGEFLDPGTSVKVIEVAGNRIVVEEA
ncbi:MAG: NfeD family protein [Planctomycetota bacterium]